MAGSFRVDTSVDTKEGAFVESDSEKRGMMGDGDWGLGVGSGPGCVVGEEVAE